MNEALKSNDHRIFGFTELGQLRANLCNGAGLPGAGLPDAGALYSWVWASNLTPADAQT